MSHLHKILTSYKLNTHQRNTYFEVLTNTCTVYPLGIREAWAKDGHCLTVIIIYLLLFTNIATPQKEDY